MKLYETTVYEGEPEELMKFMNGPEEIPKAEFTAHNLAIQRLIKENDEIKRSVEILLRGKDDTKRNKQAR